jgi:carbamoyl-phosphate synthase large subunit
MPKNQAIKKVLVIGSGPIIIGQAAEFDYAGTQACRALREEGIEIVLVNSNPATIMTDQTIADKVYIEPLQHATLEAIILRENPDSVLPTMGGQIGLNLAVELAESGCLEKNNIVLLGTSLETIKNSEDRRLFKAMMENLGEPCIPSEISCSFEEARRFVSQVGFPVVIRPAYTLGGSGGGIAHNEQELMEIVKSGLRSSRAQQVLVERSVSGWKEIEFEMMRDSSGNTVAVCDMENVDPVGIHTGDSIVVAPVQTLSKDVYLKLKDSAYRIINALKIEGGCNIQFALHPETNEYAVIEVNPRVSRSSALASKAAGYPIAKIATKIAVGYTLDEIPNSITGASFKGYEPVLEYIVLKMPRWPFDKFMDADRRLGTQMKATGEVMAVSHAFDSALLKAIRSLELDFCGIETDIFDQCSDIELMELVENADDQRIFAIAEALRRGISIEKIRKSSRIDEYFIKIISRLIEIEKSLKSYSIESVPIKLLEKSKVAGYSDMAIGNMLQSSAKDVRHRRYQNGIKAIFHSVSTSTANEEKSSPYFYSVYGADEEKSIHDHQYNSDKKILVLGSGPIRIGQGIEFDYCTVHSVWALKAAGYQPVIVNNNPETVSTDFDTAEKLYFEPLTREDIENIVHAERPVGAVVQFGGQTAIKLAKDLKEIGVQILGSSLESIDICEDREKFDQMLQEIEINRPPGKAVFTIDAALEVAKSVGYPVLVRPSYVLGGQGMEVAFNDDDLALYLRSVAKEDRKHPILIDKYLMGIEIEVDAISDGENILIPGIMEHLERAGIHSGDSISIYPSLNLDEHIKTDIVHYTQAIARQINIVGLMNIQFVFHDNKLYVIEVNPRSSRTVPFISKVTGIPMVEIATKVMLGQKLTDLSYGTGLLKTMAFSALKVPVFSFEKLRNTEISLGPGMKSTGEVLGVGRSFSEALGKGLMAAGIRIPEKGSGMLFTVKDSDKIEAALLAKKSQDYGFVLWATEKTAAFFERQGIIAKEIGKIGSESPDIIDIIESGQISLVVNTPTQGKKPGRDGFRIRRKAVEMAIPCLTTLDTVRALLDITTLKEAQAGIEVLSLDEYSGRTVG